ncbi:hypothetical protein MAR_011722 [Mya arenaria]|uniref:Uncharacterized protein n=1 Tax=Mya arenaria TaxID=6604 RepID=A0ABY7FYN8_MYAAR|nr:hypothetical protein MAR_011722 [Mya arenaria]
MFVFVEYLGLNVQLYCENGLDETIRINLLRKFKTINFVICDTKAKITASEPLVVLCTFQTRIEDSCNAAMEELQDCKSVVLVVFRRIIGSVTKNSIVSGCFYEHPGVKKTIYAGFDGNKIYFLRTDEEFIKNKADKIGDAEPCI